MLEVYGHDFQQIMIDNFEEIQQSKDQLIEMKVLDLRYNGDL
ncbi:MAG: hypothetical protein QM764_14090 [Chitinophagaceae bacterium]